MVNDNDFNGSGTTNSLLREVLREVRDQGKGIASISTKIETFEQEIIRLRNSSHEMGNYMTKEAFRVSKLEGKQKEIMGDLEDLKVKEAAVEALPEMARNRFHLYVTALLGGGAASLIIFLLERAFH